jgi:hypothetical protein
MNALSSRLSVDNFDFSRPLAPSEEVLHQELEGETVLLDLKSERYFGLDECGTRIWALLIELKRPEAVIERMMAEFDVDEDTLRADVAELLGRLLDGGLIESAQAPNRGHDQTAQIP